MASDKEQLYQERLKRYTTAMRNEKPDRVPIRPFVAEFVAKYAGYTCQEVTQDFNKAFMATRKCCAEFDWDAAVANMVYVWAGIPQAVNLKYYQIPGVGLDKDVGFNYLEPEDPWMKAGSYDELIADPTGFLYNTWLPRVSGDVSAKGEATSFRNNLSFVKGAMSMMSYFSAFGPQIAAMRSESGTVSAIAGILKAPMDILADKLRGYLGLCEDLVERPEKVKKACEALQPHLLHVASTSSDPSNTVPIGFWMHRGCVPFISFEHFNGIFWPTLKPIILELWKRGKQVLFYAEGKWAAHLKTFAELPEKSIIFHCDRDDIFEVSRVLGHRFCISGGIPNVMLAYGKPEEVRDHVRKVIQGVTKNGSYICDASAIVQNDARVENMKAMTEAAREFGVY